MRPDPAQPGPTRIGILAGGGELPRILIDAARARGRDVFVIAFKDQCDPQTVEGVEHAWMRLGQVGGILDRLKAADAKELVFAGRIDKPSMTQLMPDGRALRILSGGLFAKGDDTLLSAIVKELESKEDFRVVGVHEVQPDLLTPEGVLGRQAPDEDDQASIATACRAARELGAKDLGQAAVAKGSDVIALEERSGTDAMLKELSGHPRAQGAVLAKMLKPGQERRVDLPTIGVATIENAARAGLHGVAVEAGASLIVGREATIEAADRLGLFVVGVKP